MRQHGLLISTLILTCVFMPLMLFLFANSSIYAGDLRLVDGRRPDGDIISEEEEKKTVSAELIEELPKDMEVSLNIPLAEDTETDDIQVSGDPMSYRVYITIPTKEQNFYYKNELSGSQKGIAGITYDYADRMASFEVDTDGYYISSVYMSDDSLNLVLDSPKEKYRHMYVLDPARGGEDVGSSGYGVSEKDITLKAARAVMSAAETAGDGGFFITRNDDQYVSEEDRLRLETILEPDIYISFSVNADSRTRMTTGISAEAGSPAMREVAEVLLDAIAAETDQENRGASLMSNAAGVDGNGIVIYLGYITNKAEALKMGSDEYAEKIGNILYYLLTDTSEETIID